MAKNKKKAPLVKKSTKSTSKKKTASIVKKAVKSPAKKKATTVTKVAVKKKAISSAKKKIKSPVRKTTAKGSKKITTAPVQVPVPEVIKQNEVLHPIPGYNEMHQETIEEHKKLEHDIHSREDVIMKQENKKMKSAMANRQGIKRVFRTQRHS